VGRTGKKPVGREREWVLGPSTRCVGVGGVNEQGDRPPPFHSLSEKRIPGGIGYPVQTDNQAGPPWFILI